MADPTNLTIGVIILQIVTFFKEAKVLKAVVDIIKAKLTHSTKVTKLEAEVQSLTKENARIKRAARNITSGRGKKSKKPPTP